MQISELLVSIPYVPYHEEMASSDSSDIAIVDAELAGFDMNLLELNLSLTPDERAEQHDAALALVLELSVASLNRDENSY